MKIISWEYIIQTKKSDIDFINKVFEVSEGIGNVRTLDQINGVIKIITNEFFLSDVENVLKQLQKYHISIEIKEKREWLGVL